MKKFDYIVGVDPDINESGVAILNTSTKEYDILSLHFPLLLDKLLELKKGSQEKGFTVLICVEAGWLNRGNWHINENDSKKTSAAKGRHTGMNHQVGILLTEMVKHYGLELEVIRPFVKCWSGKNKKITHTELNYIVGGTLKGKTNQDERDAALIAWNCANFPIRCKVM